MQMSVSNCSRDRQRLSELRLGLFLLATKTKSCFVAVVDSPNDFLFHRRRSVKLEASYV